MVVQYVMSMHTHARTHTHTHRLSREEKAEESRCNYERYRALVQNLFHGVSEETALKQIDVEEMYPTNKKQKRDGKEK